MEGVGVGETSNEFNKLKEDMDWINLMIDKETPHKSALGYRQMDSSRMMSETVALSSEMIS